MDTEREQTEQQRNMRNVTERKHDEAPPDPDGTPGCPSDPVQPKAYFAPSDQWRRPSDYVAHLAHQFEEGKPDPITGKVERRPLKRDQVLFIAQFVDSCNAVWEDEQNDVPVKKRRRFSLLFIG